MLMTRKRFSLSYRIAEKLRQEVLSSGYEPGAAIASARELAGQYKVSVPTLHNALNLLVKEGLLYRVRGSGTYVSDCVKHRNRIGLADGGMTELSPELCHILNTHMDMAVSNLEKKHYTVEFVAYSDIFNPERAARLQEKFDGLLVSYNYIDQRTIRNLQKTGLPVVVYRHEFEAALPFSQVIYDLSTGVKCAIRETAAEGTEGPVIIYEDNPSGLAQMKAFKQELEVSGVTEENIEIICFPRGSRTVSSYRLVRVQHKRFRNRILWVHSDEVACYLINAFASEGMFPGRDYRIIGTGNYQLPALTPDYHDGIASIDMPRSTMAEESTRLLIYLMQNTSGSRMTVRVPTSFIMRGSALKSEIPGPMLSHASLENRKASFQPAK